MGRHKPPVGGRPTKLTQETLEKLREALSRGTTIEMACAHAGIDVSTYHHWIGQASKRRGLYAELRDMAQACMAQVTINAMAQIEGAADVIPPSEGSPGVPGDWKAAAWRVERAERILRNLSERPNVARDHEWRREEWKPYKFQGGPKVRALKVDFLAHMERLLTVDASCRAARVHRWQYKLWVEEDETFKNCVGEAAVVAAYQVEEMLLRGATSLDKDGKVQTTACFGVLNAKTTEYGLLKAQTFAQNNAKLVKEVGAILLADLPADAAAKLRERLEELVDRAAKLPPGASLR